MGFWDNLKNTVNELSEKGEKWFDENVNQKIEAKKEEYKKDIFCDACGAKLKNNAFGKTVTCEYCGVKQKNQKSIFASDKQDDKNETQK